MEQTVRDFLESENAAMTAGEIAAHLNLSLFDVKAALEGLAAGGGVSLTKRGKYAAPKTLGLVAAKVAALHSGSLQARPLDGGAPMAIRPAGALRCLPGDIVLVRPGSPNGYGARPCAVLSIAKRAHETFSAVLFAASPRQQPVQKLRHATKKERQKTREEPAAVMMARPQDVRIPYAVRVEGDLLGARAGDMVVLQTLHWPEYDKPLTARVLRITGEAERLDVQLKAIAEDAGFPAVFSEETLAEAAQLPDAPLPNDDAERKDLTDLVLFTIDGEDAKDFDDAVSLRRLPDKDWELGVHIADVSHYVAPGGALDQEAVKRGTSVYLPGLTLPMLPEKLSNGLCSLKPDQDRLAMSLIMRVREGRVADHHLTPSVIHSRARLTYTQVNRLFRGEENTVPEALADTLQSMLLLSREFREQRRKRGGIDLDLPETGFTLGPDGEPTEVYPRERGEAEKLIEDFMLAANETVAALARGADLPYIYRVHPKPDPEKLRSLELFLAGLNIRAHLGPEPHPGQLQELLNRTEETSAALAIRQVMLRTLSRAVYMERPEGHYALALRDYCHFTSPIRRYPDLMVHRMLKILLQGKQENTPGQQRRMAELAAQCSQQEYAADCAEREADSLLKARYMARHIGEMFDGMVTGVTAWGFYVTLPNTVEGLVPLGTLEDYYEYDEVSSTLRPSRNGRIIRLGMHLKVRVSRVDIPRREVNFAAGEGY